MNAVSLLGLALATLVLAASPGPGVVTTVARSLSCSLRSALLHVAGMVAGDLLYLLFAIFGLSIVARELGELFWLVRLAGGCYLAVLGVKTWRAGAGETPQAWRQTAGPVWTVVLGGLAVSLSNPKVIIFYCGFLPAFLDLGALSLLEIGLVVAVMSAILFSVLAAYAVLAGSARTLFADTGARRWLNRASGGALAAVGVAIAVRR